jgi:glyoxylase-like metal-dependent hydrolase (beta-lactamase superfamily II)
MLGFLGYSLRKDGMRTRYVQEVVEFADGDVLDLPGSPRIVGMPGHSPGSVAVHVPAADAVFVGDALTTRHVLTGRRGPQPAPFTDEPGQALASLDRLAAVSASWVLPGHGAPWRGSPAELAAAVRRVIRRPSPRRPVDRATHSSGPALGRRIGGWRRPPAATPGESCTTDPATEPSIRRPSRAVATRTPDQRPDSIQ